MFQKAKGKNFYRRIMIIKFSPENIGFCFIYFKYDALKYRVLFSVVMNSPLVVNDDERTSSFCNWKTAKERMLGNIFYCKDMFHEVRMQEY